MNPTAKMQELEKRALHQSASLQFQRPDLSENTKKKRAVWNATKKHMPELADRMPEISRLGIASIAIHDNHGNLIAGWRR